MSAAVSEAAWHEIGWSGVLLNLPAAWQPTAIYPSYLFFEQGGRAVLEIKWQTIRGRFSIEKNLAGIRKTLQNDAELNRWNPPPALQQPLASYKVSGFQLHRKSYRTHGLLLFCPECRRVTLMQWHMDTIVHTELLAHILGSFRDHGQFPEQIWSIFDIRASLPVEAKLRTHKFLPGKYTLQFDLGGTALTLYRFKPAAVLLQRKSIGEFGSELLHRPPIEEENGQATWQFRTLGLELLLQKMRRKPVWQWMRLWHESRHNAILGVRAEGEAHSDTEWLLQICRRYVSVASHQV